MNVKEQAECFKEALPFTAHMITPNAIGEKTAGDFMLAETTHCFTAVQLLFENQSLL